MSEPCPTDELICAYVERSTSDDERDGIDEHLDSCDDCRRAVAELIRGRLPGVNGAEISSGTRVGRFVIVGMLGEGAMGTVYLGYDPQLDRRVAVKVLREDRDWGERARERLLAEAQSMAQVSHPNAITVFEVGTHGEQIFIAMEYVEGVTLRGWLDGDRGRGEILDAFAAAGAGLHAAHQAGIVHRDFKPDNVLCGDGGEVVVTDFGLASSVGDDDSAIAGTPAYMAPEQLRGDTASPAADQFSFAVALYEGLAGERPFAPVAGSDMAAAIDDTDRRAIAARLPRGLRGPITRGLEPDPERRYPSMAALLAAIERARARPRRIATAIGALAAAGVIALGASYSTSDGGPRCDRAADDFDRAYDAGSRAAIATALAGSPTAAGSALAGLDDFASSWRRERIAACRDTFERGAQSEATFDRRARCLERQRVRLDELLEVLGGDRGTAPDRVIGAIAGLPNPAECADLESLERVPMPADPSIRAGIAELQKQLGRARALWAIAALDELGKLAPELVARARELGYQPAIAEAHYLLGLFHSRDRAARSLDSLYRAAAAAVASDDPRLAVDVWVRLSFVLGYSLDQHDAAIAISRVAETGLVEVDDAAPLRAEMLRIRGTIHNVRGEYREAVEAGVRSVELLEDRPRALRVELAGTLQALAMTYNVMGRHADALPLQRRALAIEERTYGRDHPYLYATLTGLAVTLAEHGELEEALAAIERAGALIRRTQGEDSTSFAVYSHKRGEVLLAAGDAGGALEAHRKGLAIREQTFAADHVYRAWSHVQVGTALAALGDHRAARRQFDRALAAFEGKLGSDHPHVARTLQRMGEAELRGGGDRQRARRSLERALAIRVAKKVPRPQLAETRFALARALIDDDIERAMELAGRAREDYRALGDARGEIRVSEWRRPWELE